MTDAQVAQLKTLVAKLDTDQTADDAAIAAHDASVAAQATAMDDMNTKAAALAAANQTVSDDVASIRAFVDAL